jgi:hypothetical protein
MVAGMFEIFTEHTVIEECRQMFLVLKKADYAVSSLDKETIEKYAEKFQANIVARKLKDGRTKVAIRDGGGK